METKRVTCLLTHPQECPHASCSALFWQRCEGAALQPNTCRIITMESTTGLAKSPNHSKSKNNIRACALKKSPAFMWQVTRGDEVALACLLLHDPREGDRLEQCLALFAYATLPPPLPPPPPCLLFTLYPTQQKIELTLACGHFTSLEFNPTPLCLSLLGQSVRG